MPKMTKQAWLNQLNECGGDLSQDALINLVFKDGPNALWTDISHQMHTGNQYSLYKYLTSLFPTRVWNDWSGQTELGSVYHAAYLPFDLSIFQRSMNICSPDSLDECHTDYCEIPRGGISHIPELEMYKTGFKTKPMCIANIRTSMQAKKVAEFIVKERFQVDENVMNSFYVMALIRMLGHKWILEVETDANGNTVPVTNVNPYNCMGGYRYSYLNPLFPMAGNINNIAPLGLDTLDLLGRALVDSRNPNHTGMGPRGEPIFELWHGSDWYRQEIIDNPEWIERNKYTMPAKLLAGYTNDPGEREVVGNFSMKVMANLPRFAESTEGGLTVVQPMQQVEVDEGTRSIHSYVEYGNAPFGLTVALGRGIGEILSRPAISTGIEGREIMPITGNGDWVYRNDYDKDCNEDLNMPHFRKRFEMGFRMKDGDAGWGFIHRNKGFRIRPINMCNLKPVFKVAPATLGCDSILTIGCNPQNDKVSNSIITATTARRVACGSEMCGKDTIWRLAIRHENQDSIAPGQSPLGSCVCGDSIQVFVGDADGDVTLQVPATIIEIMRPTQNYPRFQIFVELEAALSAGFCIHSVACKDDTPNNATVIHCIDDDDDDNLAVDEVRYVLDSSLPCVAGSDVTITYYDAEGTSLGTVSGTIASFDIDRFTYTIQSDEADYGCAMFDDQCTVKITCDDPVYGE